MESHNTTTHQLLKPFKNVNKKDFIIVIRRLFISNATTMDTGDFTCSLRKSQNETVLNATKHIKVYGKNKE